MCHFLCVFLFGVRFLVGDKQEAKFRGVMSAQNTHDILVFYHVFVSFHIVISVVITLYMIFGFLCTSGEKDSI